MIEIIEMRKAILSFLKSRHPRVYFEVAPGDAQSPYIVYDLPSAFDDGSMENFVLDIDGWDTPDNGDTTALETLMAAIDGNGDRFNPTGLHRKTISLSGLAMTFYRENRLVLHDDDVRIRRRKYVYQIRKFAGG